MANGLSAIVYGLNRTNEVSGYCVGSPQYVVQREFCRPTCALGSRWTSATEKWMLPHGVRFLR